MYILTDNAKWILNVQWQMEGVDIHLDTNIGKQLSALFKTLTALTSVEDEVDGIDYNDVGAEETRHRPSIQVYHFHSIIYIKVKCFIFICACTYF